MSPGEKRAYEQHVDLSGDPTHTSPSLSEPQYTLDTLHNLDIFLAVPLGFILCLPQVPLKIMQRNSPIA